MKRSATAFILIPFTILHKNIMDCGVFESRLGVFPQMFPDILAQN